MEMDLADASAIVARMDDTHTATAHRQQADDIPATASSEGARSVGRAPLTSELLSCTERHRRAEAAKTTIETTTEQ